MRLNIQDIYIQTIFKDRAEHTNTQDMQCSGMSPNIPQYWVRKQAAEQYREWVWKRLILKKTSKNDKNIKKKEDHYKENVRTQHVLKHWSLKSVVRHSMKEDILKAYNLYL